MQVNTKFNIGQEVFAAFKDGEFVSVARGVINEIVVKSDHSIAYYLDTICEPFNEDEVAHVNDKVRLYSLIKRLSLEGETNGREIN